MRAIIATALTLLAASPAMAHDFWIAPDHYAVEVNEQIELGFLVGHGASAEPWDLRWRRVVSLETWLGREATPRLDSFVTLSDGSAGAGLIFERAGHHIVAFASHHAYSELPGDGFADYLQEEGLDLVADIRVEAGLQDEPGRELYSRRAKTLIDVGEGDGGDPTLPVGHTLEIVPLSDPYAEDFDGMLDVRVLFRGEPLEGAQLSYASLDIGRTVDTLRTDENGIASFTVPQIGRWMFNTVWSTPIEGHDTADYETIFASLTFGYAP